MHRGQGVLAGVLDETAEVGLEDEKQRQGQTPEPQILARPHPDEREDGGRKGEHDRQLGAAGVHLDPGGRCVPFTVVLQEDAGPDGLKKHHQRGDSGQRQRSRSGDE